jgi:hypothetical protein
MKRIFRNHKEKDYICPVVLIIILKVDKNGLRN